MKGNFQARFQEGPGPARVPGLLGVKKDTRLPSPEHAGNQGAPDMSKAKDKPCPKGGQHELVTTVIPGTKKCKKCGQVFEE